MRHMRRVLAPVAALALTGLGSLSVFGAGSPWGEDYFPNVPLVTQDGETVRFFDDLIKDKIVAINFIYTTCVDTCPLETARLAGVQRILGDRLGKDIFFYSITIDPEHDTPAVLKEYREMFGARWTFLTGDNADIIELRKKLGLYVEEIQDGSLNHNVNMIIGNQATGRWMKRSPFENPYVLADQLGNWLNDWRSPPVGESYANAPKLRNISRGEQLFRTRCTTCHTITGIEAEDALGPDLMGVTQKRERTWLINWLRAPDQMLEQGDPIATALYAQYNNLVMPNMRLNQQEAMDLIEYMDEESQRIAGSTAHDAHAGHAAHAGHEAHEPAVVTVARPGDVVAIAGAWLRQAPPAAKANAGYMTLVNQGSEDVTLVKVESEGFDTVEMHEMAMVDGLMAMREVTDLVVPADGQAEFAPGGRHLMLEGPRRHFQAGEQVELTLTFESGNKQTISVEVAAR